MLRRDDCCFIRDPRRPDERILHPAKVLEAERNVLAVWIEEPDFAGQPDQNVQVYYESDREFLQQDARIIEIPEMVPRLVIRLETIGKPVSAESRQSFRVSTLIIDLTTKFGPEDNCPLLDVSATGFAVIAARQYQLGDIVPVTLYFDNEEFSGAACIKSVRALKLGRFRYGLHGIDDPIAAGSLPKGLNKICMAVQREQLRRLAGSRT